MKGQQITQPRWAIVLAGGDGTRLQNLTQKIEGDARPKQFSRIFGDRSLLSHTRERLKPIFGDHRSMFVVTKKHENFYTEELARCRSFVCSGATSESRHRRHAKYRDRVREKYGRASTFNLV